MSNNARAQMDRPALLMTRPAESAAAFLDALGSEVLSGVEVCLSPLLEIVPLDVTPDLAGRRGFIFTSANAVGFVGPGAGQFAFCVGAQTAERAEAAGWQVLEVAETADALVERLLRLSVEGPLLHVAGRHRRGDIDARLTAAGLKTEVIAVYDQKLAPLTSDARRILETHQRVIVPLFSPRTAKHFMQEVAGASNAVVLAISAAVAEQIDPARVSAVHTVAAPTSDEMRRAVEMMLRKDSLP